MSVGVQAYEKLTRSRRIVKEYRERISHSNQVMETSIGNGGKSSKSRSQTNKVTEVSELKRKEHLQTFMAFLLNFHFLLITEQSFFRFQSRSTNSGLGASAAGRTRLMEETRL